jgi:hypothetical protein
MKNLLLTIAIIGILFSIGPERFFLNGKEVSKGTAGAVSGDQLARENLGKPEPESGLAGGSGRYWHGHGYRGRGYGRGGRR